MYACRVRAFVTLSEVTGTVSSREDRLRAGAATREQHPEAQHDALPAAGCEPCHISIDKVRGKLARRPGLDKGLLVVRPATSSS